MDIFSLQATLLASQLTMTAAAYVASQSTDEENANNVAEKRQKGEGFKGFLKKLNPVRLFDKIFKRDKTTSKDDPVNEI